ncbi:MAG: DUF1611 domain-containing protein, partial [bacterium]|nr:DUF1611 domain-containing protein [bacterium]
MTAMPEGNAIVFCEGAFETPNGKTAHGLVRFTERYRILSVIDSQCAGADAGTLLDGTPKSIPVVATLEAALQNAKDRNLEPTHLVVGLAPDGGRLPSAARQDIIKAIEAGLHIDSGLHDFLSEDSELAAVAAAKGVVIRDVRKPPLRSQL